MVFFSIAIHAICRKRAAILPDVRPMCVAISATLRSAAIRSRSSCSNPSLVDPDATEDADLMSGLKPDGLDFTYAFAVLVLVSLALLAWLHYQYYWSDQSDSNASLNQVVGCVSEVTHEGDESTPLRAGAMPQQPPRGNPRSKAR